MKLKIMVMIAGVCQQVMAHTLLTTLFVNDISQGDGTCIRMPREPGTATNPVIDLSSKEMVCGFNGDKAVDRVCSVPQSAKLSFLFRSWPDGSQQGSIDSSHKGPCAVYMKAQSFSGDWFKIWDEGYNPTTSQWCSENIMKNNGFLSIKLPSNLVGGHYLVRVELLALHMVDKNPPQPQFYVGCAQIFLNSAGVALPLETVRIPGHVSLRDPGLVYNIYDATKPPYLIPGPKRYESATSASSKVKQAQEQQSGLLPANVVVTNANWWGVEVPSYTDEAGCREASTSCWDQLDKCYATAPPTGSAGCKIWEAKCMKINDSCNSPSYQGPPNTGKYLGLPPPTYTIPSAEEVDIFVSAAHPVPEINTSPGNQAATKIHSSQIDTSPRSTRSATKVEYSQIITIPSSNQAATSVHYSQINPSSSTQTATKVQSSQISKSTYLPSTNDRCGWVGNETSCVGSIYGRCCSASCYCGNSVDHCGSGVCQPHFGECGGGEELVRLEEKEERIKRIRNRRLMRRG